MALAYLTINLDAFTGDDRPPLSSYSTITLDPGADHIDAAADVIHVRTIVVSLDRQGKAATANGVPCIDGKVPVVAGVAYAVSAPNVLRGGPHCIPALTAGQVVALSDYITPGTPLTPDQTTTLTARIVALEAAPPGVTDHGALTGLGEDGHTQYALANGTRGAFAAPLGADDNYVTDAEKAALHAHSNKAALDLVSGTNTGDQVLPTWSTISGKPAVVAEGATQAAARTAIGLGSAATTASTAYATAAQGTKADGAAQKSANLSDLADAATARTNLGLDTAATVGALPIPDPGSFYPTDTITAALQLIGGRELYGTGSPEGVVTAAVGTYYTDTVGTVGAWRWQKKTGAGNTGWKVIHGDTGLRSVTALLKNGWTGQAYLRRVNDMVDIRFDSLNASAASSGVPLTLPSGFSLTNGLVHRSIFYTTAMTLRRVSTFNDVTIVGYAAGDVLIGTLTSITGDAWPTTLPGTAA